MLCRNHTLLLKTSNLLLVHYMCQGSRLHFLHVTEWYSILDCILFILFVCCWIAYPEVLSASSGLCAWGTTWGAQNLTWVCCMQAFLPPSCLFGATL